jgi:site-specific DNA-methyltransferase (adenine-specific)
MSLLLHGDCLEQMKGIDTDSVDFIFCDLPYGQTSCKWDTIIPWEPFWNEIMRVKKLNTPIFFTTTTKFGVELINNAPKKCPFRYDLVWVKSAPAGFLSAKKMPMRKHEMVYAFYEKLPLYDLSSHKHKFLKEKKSEHETLYGGVKVNNIDGNEREARYDPPLPTSVVKEDVYDAKERFKNGKLTKHPRHLQKGDDPIYDPPLPTSVVKEDERKINPKNSNKGGLYSKIERLEDVKYDPPLPTTMLEIKSTRGKHSTEKPVALMEWLLKYYSKEGDVVLDPTMGSGSTGVACKNMNRNFIGIEKDPEIYEVAVNRIES